MFMLMHKHRFNKHWIGKGLEKGIQALFYFVRYCRGLRIALSRIGFHALLISVGSLLARFQLSLR